LRQRRPTVADMLCKPIHNQQKFTYEDFDVLNVVGRGSFGKVLQVRKKYTEEIYAMKVLRKDFLIEHKEMDHVRDERHILERIKHPFIVKLFYAFQDEDRLYLVLDFINGGEIYFHLKRQGKFSESRVRLYAAEITAALVHLHNNGIIYRDLKAENVLLDSEGHIVITDFGLSKDIVSYKDITKEFCGTVAYIAPEIFKGKGYSFPVDFWSLGILVYVMLVGKYPFVSNSPYEMYRAIMNDPVALPAALSDEICDFVMGLLEIDPSKRLTAQGIMGHTFNKQIDWRLLNQRKIQPEFVPQGKDKTSVENFSSEYLDQDKQTTLIIGKRNNTKKISKSQVNSPIVQNFSYVGPK